MRIHIAGGAPSTGSSLIRSIINAHPEFMAGPETYLFAHPRLYTNWPNNKHLLLTRGFKGLKNETPFQLNGAQLDKPWYGWSKEELIDLIQSSNTLPSFCQSYFQKSLKPGTTGVVEKSPVNAYCFQQFLDIFPDSSVIHCIRNPYDAIASMVARGLSPYLAVSFYVFNTSFGLLPKTNSRYMEIRYESLVAQPDVVMTPIMEKLGAFFQSEQLQTRQEEAAEPTRLQGWHYDENDQVGQGSIGRFESADPQTRKAILQACQHIYITKHWVKKHALPAANIAELCAILDYPVLHDSSIGKSYTLKLDWLKDQFRRAGKGYPNSFFKSPVRVD